MCHDADIFGLQIEAVSTNGKTIQRANRHTQPQKNITVILALEIDLTEKDFDWWTKLIGSDENFKI